MSRKKDRMSMLDNLAAAGGPTPTTAGSMMSSNRALRSARDAVDSHTVWELEPASIQDDRTRDRLDPADVHDLREAIEVNGQTVPILVRRDPGDPDRYLLVYGRRRLEAIRGSEKVTKIRALVANLDERSALTAQISENMARRDLSYIEKALFAKELVASGYGNQKEVAEVLTVTRSSVSMALAVVDMIGADLIQAIGAAHGVGRPKWEALGRAVAETDHSYAELIAVADDALQKASQSTDDGLGLDPSLEAFEAVLKAAQPKSCKAAPTPTVSRALTLDGVQTGAVKRTSKSVTITLDDSAFAQWIDDQADNLIAELHARWKTGLEN